MGRELYQYPLHGMTVYPGANDTDMMKMAVVRNMDSAEDVARTLVKGLLNQEINVILGARSEKSKSK